jgi:hypothetical protein
MASALLFWFITLDGKTKCAGEKPLAPAIFFTGRTTMLPDLHPHQSAAQTICHHWLWKLAIGF